jgi:glycosyltransferase involved in cell wall biosynthesis
LDTSEKIETIPDSILVLARLDPSKKPEIILQACRKLLDRGRKFQVSFVGGASKDKFPNYEAEILKLKDSLKLGDVVKFVGAVPSTDTFRYYLSHEVYINVAKSGMLDKTIFKALAAGCVTITTSNDFNEMIAPVAGESLWVVQDSVDSLVEKIEFVLDMDKTSKQEVVKGMQEIILRRHCLDELVSQLRNEMGPTYHV